MAVFSVNEVVLKTRPEIHRIRYACTPIEELFRSLPSVLKTGYPIEELRSYCLKFLRGQGCEPALRGFNGFPEDICISVNNVAAHGVSTAEVLQEGDLVTIDVTTVRDGWHGDGAWTFAVGRPGPAAKRLLRCAWQATREGILALKAGFYLSEVGKAIDSVARRYGCTVLPYFVGHGIGRSIHEEPKVLHTLVDQLPCPVVPGLVVTIEPIVSLGGSATKLLDDGWSQTTVDGSLTAQFEHTVAVFSTHTEVLTMRNQRDLLLDFPPFI
ncbi:type I methionyl aminopeptidase [Marispirochaeta aestuarii]|uniref:Methionine aminopeptidase n=1 Tax=Marispirochaeta aestuarii TaxID=1963862 RepID=A0A1Y1RU84_9SPIO|nr:type I methionyl aminopeptidase [Marispirochaeta aestuarii]ORC31889.1 type I methionyl aminopeptidase [Marispirochaeta aestuarii]